MAEVSDGPITGRAASPVGAPIASFVQYAGAAVSLALVAGVGVWGYKLLVRDVNGIPVVHAMEGPMREAPSNPGGELPLHTGLAVNAIAALGEAAPPEDRLILAPAAAGLAQEDLEAMPMAEAAERLAGDDPQQVPAALSVATPEPSLEAVAEPLEEGVVEPVIAETDLPATDGPLSADDILALADAIAANSTPLTDLAPAPEPLAEASPAARAVRPMLRPMQRPGLADPAVLASGQGTDSAAPGGAAIAVMTGDIAIGTSLVQLGAYETPEIATAEWARLAGRFASFVAGKTPVIQQATSGGRTFFRLRAMGFDTLSDARRFCAALVAEDAACIPVVVR